jgi:hypothetical protein
VSTLRIAWQQAVAWTREHAGQDGMSRREAARWAACPDMTAISDLVIRWLDGRLAQNPDHEGPPCAETIPLAGALTAVNRAGFLTDSSQLAGHRRGGRSWNAWVCGFVSDQAVLARLDQALQTYGLELEDCCPDGDCDPDCPRQEVLYFWARACPLAAAELAGAWWVYAEDPEPGRNDRLWPALEGFASAIRYVPVRRSRTWTSSSRRTGPVLPLPPRTTEQGDRNA